MKFVSWNVNGLRAVLKKNFYDVVNDLDADWFCIQETKMQEGQAKLDLPGYHQYFNYAERKGYSGTAIFTKHEPISVHNGIDVPEYDTEGRVITLEYPTFYMITVYVPNSGGELKRLEFRQGFDKAFRAYTSQLSAKKPVIYCGDLNVAHEEIDLKNPKTNHHSAGFTDEERTDFTAQLDAGFTDTFRHFYPDRDGIYSWWSYRGAARSRNAGWRIDYFVTSQAIDGQLQDAVIHDDILGSDHCPVELTTKNLLED
ncbi:exodeoxyribonuclease III [Lacticaseibacillus pabuli]|uniref:Exodeoxyribonuclease III n=1 Tax=Lacticaseibacillus pabuli TaxID=3025672 RepID=A0ABY7WP13_9LACO|nr:exodeoxyribonuclease III [Lacticaseibacillus sp. KACC 23028]WDF81943.1 exodeoxyribonuclease III [Lacticaseibacillus sp. KACC 23028]